MLGIIFFAMLFGYFMTRLENQYSEPLYQFWDGVFHVMMRMTEWIMKFAPIGVFGLVAAVIAKAGYKATGPLATFAVVVLSCGLKNYLSYLVNGTALCPYLCPSWFAKDDLGTILVLGQLFEAQAGIQTLLQGFANQVWSDSWNLTTFLLIAPLIEEVVYRGPLYLGRRWNNTSLWWFCDRG